MPINLKQLHHMVLLSEEQHFGRAAERAFLSASAFSRSVAALEESVSMPLFDRRANGVRLTMAGERVLARAKRLLLCSEELSEELRLLRTGELGDLVVGAGPLSAPAVVLPAIAAFQQAHPRVGVRLDVAHTRELQRRLMEEQLDFFVADVRELIDHERCAVEPIGRMRLSLMCREGHPLAGRATVTLGELRAQRLASVHIPAILSARLAKLIARDEKGMLPLALECESVIVLREYALRTDAVILAAPQAMGAERPGCGLCSLQVRELSQLEDQNPLAVAMGLVTLKDRTRTASMDMLIDVLRTGASARGGQATPGRSGTASASPAARRPSRRD